MQPRHLLVQFFRQRVDAPFEFSRSQFDLSQALVGEAVAHHETGMTGGTAQIDQPPLGQNEDGSPGFERPFVNLGFDGRLFQLGMFLQVTHVDLIVEVPDVADDGLVFHLFHVRAGDHQVAPRGGHENIAHRCGRVHGRHLEALHGCLQGADGIDLRHQDSGAIPAHGVRTALAHVAVTADHDHLARHHDIRGPFDTVGQGFAAAVKIVELGLGNRVVDVEGRKEQLTGLGQLIQAVNAGRGLLGDTSDPFGDLSPEARILVVAGFQTGHQQLHVGRIVVLFQQRRVLFHGHTLVNEHGRIAAVVHDQVRAAAVRPNQGLFGAPPVLRQGFPFPCEYGGRAFAGNGRGGVILGGKDVARCPADIGAQGLEGVDQHGRLDGHVQTAGHLEPLEGLLGTILFTHRHESRHFVFSQLQLPVTKIGQLQIGHFVRQRSIVGRRPIDRHDMFSKCHWVSSSCIRETTPNPIIDYSPAFSRMMSTMLVCSQEKLGPVRPKWPYAAVSR